MRWEIKEKEITQFESQAHSRYNLTIEFLQRRDTQTFPVSLRYTVVFVSREVQDNGVPFSHSNSLESN